MSRFPKFSELPQELQDQIWDMAIRDDEPAAQFFTIYDRDYIFSQCPVGLTAPHKSGVDGNESAYMTDSGLWTACWGSRARMLWRFKPAETSALMSRLAPVTAQAAQEICRRPTAFVTMPFQRDDGSSGGGGRQCYLTIKPTEDLLHFNFAGRARPEPNTDHYYWKFFKDIPALRWKLPGGEGRAWHAPLHVRHVAVEYHPWWRDSDFCFEAHRLYYEAKVRPRAEQFDGPEMFWLVDYGLRRRFRVDLDLDPDITWSSRRGRRTFRAGDDHEFVEVFRDDDEWRDLSSSYGRTGGFHGDGDTAAHYLAKMMQARERKERTQAETDAEDAVRQAQQNNDIAAEEDAFMALDRISQQTPVKFGVLAYVKRGSDRNLPTELEWYISRYLRPPRLAPTDWNSFWKFVCSDLEDQEWKTLARSYQASIVRSRY